MGQCLLFNFVVWGLIGSGLCLFGYIGNLLSVFALQRELRTPTTTLLQSLAISDLVLLLSVCITDAVPYICAYTGGCSDPWVVWPNIRYVWMFTPVSHMCSIWLVVLISGNRYWAVCRPHSTGRVWTNRRTGAYVVFVVCLVVAFNAPRLFEYDFKESCFETNRTLSNYSEEAGVEEASKERWPRFTTLASVMTSSRIGGAAEEIDGGSNAHINGHVLQISINLTAASRSSCNGVIRLEEIKTDFGDDYSYRVVYKVILVNTLLVLLPLAFLLVSSIWIVRTLRLSHRMSTMKKRPPTIHEVQANHTTTCLVPNGGCTTTTTGVLSAEASPVAGLRRATDLTHTDSVRSNDAAAGGGSTAAPPPSYSKRATPSREVTFLLITVVLVALFCQTPLAVFHFVRYAYEYHCGDTVFYLEMSSKFLVNLNSCINFVLYCLLSPKFRRMLSDLLTCKRNGLRGRAGVGGATSVNQRIQFEFSVRESKRRRT